VIRKTVPIRSGNKTNKMKTYHVLGILHCKNCPCLGGIPHGLVCNIKGYAGGYIGEFSGSEEWKNFFPKWCPLLKCNYKKPTEILSLNSTPGITGFYYDKKVD